MESDQVSRTSVDSLSVAEEFVVVTPTDDKARNSSPTSSSSNGGETGLKITGNGNMEDLKQNLDEVLSDDNTSDQSPMTPNDPLCTKTTPPISLTNPDGVVSDHSTVAYNMQVSTGSSSESYDICSDMHMPVLGERVMSGHVGSAQGQFQDDGGDDVGKEDPWVPRAGE